MGTDPHRPRAIVCTGNAHKVDELGDVLHGFALEALAPGTDLPPEIGETFVDNARIKAAAGQGMHPDTWVIADDSGLVVDALDGAPGVISARFAGEGATDIDNVRLLLERLDEFVGEHERRAHFVCVLVAIAPDGTEFVAEGRVDGTITRDPAGAGGFGYDPVFVPLGETLSFAELGAEVKATMSHRARAAAELDSRIGKVVA